MPSPEQSPPTPSAEWRERVAKMIRQMFADKNGRPLTERSLELADEIAAVSGGVQDRSLCSVASGLTPLVASREEDAGPAKPLGGEYPLHVEELAEAHACIQRLCASLRDFIDDGRFQVSVGGNPIAVAAMLQRAAKALAMAEGWA